MFDKPTLNVSKDEVTLLILAKWNGNILLKMKF